MIGRATSGHFPWPQPGSGQGPRNLDGHGINSISQAGGGVHGHPDVTTTGAREKVQVTEAWQKHIALEEYAKDHKELEVALEFWGC